MTEKQFEDADNFSYNYDKDKLTFKDIILQHLKKISQHASVEFRGGYWQEQSSPVGGGYSKITRVYIPDSREVYTNSVMYLADMLYPYFDDEMRKAEEEIQEEINEAFKENTLLLEKDREDSTSDEGEKYRCFDTQKDKISFRSVKRDLTQKLFRHLSSFLYRKKYLEIGTIED